MSRQPHPLATLAQIVSSPSIQDGIPRELEEDLRVVGCMMIQEAGIMLDLPQSTMATAQVIFHRFFFVSSVCSFGIQLLVAESRKSASAAGGSEGVTLMPQDISIASLYLSTKLNESPVRLRDLINTYMFLSARIEHLLSFPADQPLPTTSLGGSSASRYNAGLDSKGKGKQREKVFEGMVWEVPGFHDEVFWDCAYFILNDVKDGADKLGKDSIVASEMQILKRLGFNMQVDLPYNHAINYLKILDLVFEPDVAQMTWSILNDLLLSPVYAMHPPHVLACAAILLTTRLLRIPLPKDWHTLFDVEWDDIWGGCGWAIKLWRDWGLEPVRASAGPVFGQRHEGGGGKGETDEERKEKENRWRRAWVLMQGKKTVRRWVEEREAAQGADMRVS